MSEKKGPCDGCDCSTPCPCVCVCTPCNCLCISKGAPGNAEIEIDLDSQIVMRRIGGLDLATLAAVLDINSTVDIFVPERKALEQVSIAEFPSGTLQEALEQLGLEYK